MRQVNFGCMYVCMYLYIYMYVVQLDASPHSLLNWSQWNLYQSIDKTKNERVVEVSAPETNQEAVWEAKTPQKLDITAKCIMCFLSCEGTVSVIINRRKLVLIPIDCKFCPPCRGGVEKSKFHPKLFIWVKEWTKDQINGNSLEATNALIVARFSVFTQPIFYLVKNGLHQCVPENFPVKNNMLFSWKTKKIMVKRTS